MPRIELSSSYGRNLEVIVDQEDLPSVLRHRWYTRPLRQGKGNTHYVWTSLGTGLSNIFLHRFITNADSTQTVDHANGNGLDNRRANLRVCTVAENAYNRQHARNNTTGYKGVTVHKQSGKFQAAIGFGGKRMYLGLFETAEEAHNAYREAATREHGLFARMK